MSYSMRKSISKILNWNIPLSQLWILLIAGVSVFLIYLALGIFMGLKPIFVVDLFVDIISQLLIASPFCIIVFFITNLFMSLLFRLNKNLDKVLFPIVLIIIIFLFPFCFLEWIQRPLALFIDRITYMGIKSSLHYTFTICCGIDAGLLLGSIKGYFLKS